MKGCLIGVLVLVGLVILLGIIGSLSDTDVDSTPPRTASTSPERRTTTEAKSAKRESGTTDSGFYNAVTGKHYSTAEMMRSMELLNKAKASGRRHGYMADCEANGSTVVAIAGPLYSGYARSDREALLETLFLGYSALEEIRRVEMRSRSGEVLATYTPSRGFRD